MVGVHMKKILIGSVAAMALFAGSANAAIVIDLNLGNPGINSFPGPYAQVTVDLTSSTTANISFASLTNGGNVYLMGGSGVAGVNVNALSWTVSALTGSNSGSGFSGPSLSNGGSSNEDGFGSFNQTFNEFDGYQYSLTNLSFTLTNTGGTWGSDSEVLIGNASGFTAASHIFVASQVDFQNGATIPTGFATVGGVPEPATWALMMVGFGLIGFAMRRRPAAKDERAFA